MQRRQLGRCSDAHTSASLCMRLCVVSSKPIFTPAASVIAAEMARASAAALPRLPAVKICSLEKMLFEKQEGTALGF